MDGDRKVWASLWRTPAAEVKSPPHMSGTPVLITPGACTNAWSRAVVTASVMAACTRAPVAQAPVTPQPSTPAMFPSGLNQPENLVYDAAADVYLVSNMGGGDTARDDNGFISRMRPDGTMADARWIAGGVNGVRLDAPKGLAIRGDTLAVADLGSVHEFNRRTGAPLRTIALRGLVMNDLAFDANGALWVTETGPSRTPAPVDTSHGVDALWRIGTDGSVKAVARGLALDRPDGIVLDGADALIATFGSNRIERIHSRTEQGRSTVATLAGGRLDGLRRLPDGALVITSWDAQTVWRLVPGEPPRVLLSGVVSPAGVAVDTRRHQLAVTSMQTNALYLVPLR
jgi:sugar lactone lactonase YvrE